MSDAHITVSTGAVAITIDQPGVMAQLDRMVGGAVRTFLDAAHRQMDPVVEQARTTAHMWPRRTGRSQESTREVERVGDGFVELVAVNDVPYTYRLRFSVVTRDTIETEPTEVANRTWANLAPYVERGNTERARKRIARQWIAQASGGLIKGWWWGRDPSARAIRDMWHRQLTDSHGSGAPNERLAGKHVWSTLVRNPLKKREAALVAESRAALDSLAQD